MSTQQYLIAKARNLTTGVNVKQQDLSGARYTMSQRKLALIAATRLAEQLTVRTGDTWEGYVEAYTPTYRR